MAGSLADSEQAVRPAGSKDSPGPENQAYTVAGVLTASGNVTVNDNLARTGTTVLSGSKVATGGDGLAAIDLGPKGLIEMRPDTRILLTLPADDQVRVDLQNCGVLTQSVPENLNARVKIVDPHRLRIYVTVGSVVVHFGERKDTTTVTQFEDKTLDNVTDIDTRGNTVFTVDCNMRPLAVWWIPASLIGLAALAVGVTRDKGNPPNPVPTPPPATALTPR
jgi:hypothetical protein